MASLANELKAYFTADTSDLEKGAKKADQVISKFERDIKKVGQLGDEFISVGKGLTAGISAPITALGLAIGKVTTDFVSFSSTLSSSADQAGLAVETYQELSFALNQYGISNTDAERTLGRLNQRIGLAIEGNEKYAGALQSLGVSLTDNTGRLKATEDVFLDIAQSLSEIENPATRAAKASDFFGVNLSRRLLPALSDGEEGIKAFIQQARDMGVVMESGQIQAAEQLGIAVNNLKLQFSTITREIGSAFVPVINDVLIPAIQNRAIPLFQKFADHVRALTDGFTSLPSGMQKGILAITGVAAALGPLSLAIGGVLKAVPLIVSGLGGIGGALTALTGPIGLVVAGLAGISVAVVKNWDKIKPYIISVANGLIDIYNNSTFVRTAVQGIMLEFKIVFAYVKNYVSTTWEVVKSFIQAMADGFRGVGNIIRGAFTGNTDSIKRGLAQIGKTSIDLFDNLKNDFADGWQSLRSDVVDAWNKGMEEVANPKKLDYITDLAFGGLGKKISDKVSEEVTRGLLEGLGRPTQIAIQAPGIEGVGSIGDMFDKQNQKIDKSLKRRRNYLDTSVAELKVWRQELADELSRIGSMGLADLIGGAFEDIGRSIADGGNVMENMALGAIRAMGGIMQQFGKAMIAFGTAKIALDALFSNPFTAIAAGAGLVALGALISQTSANTQRQLQGVGTGGGVGGGSIQTGTGGNYQPQQVNTGNYQAGEQRVVFEIAGQKLIGVLSNTLNRNKRLGGQFDFG